MPTLQRLESYVPAGILVSDIDAILYTLAGVTKEERARFQRAHGYPDVPKRFEPLLVKVKLTQSDGSPKIIEGYITNYDREAGIINYIPKNQPGVPTLFTNPRKFFGRIASPNREETLAFDRTVLPRLILEEHNYYDPRLFSDIFNRLRAEETRRAEAAHARPVRPLPLAAIVEADRQDLAAEDEEVRTEAGEVPAWDNVTEIAEGAAELFRQREEIAAEAAALEGADTEPAREIAEPMALPVATAIDTPPVDGAARRAERREQRRLARQQYAITEVRPQEPTAEMIRATESASAAEIQLAENIRRWEKVVEKAQQALHQAKEDLSAQGSGTRDESRIDPEFAQKNHQLKIAKLELRIAETKKKLADAHVEDNKAAIDRRSKRLEALKTKLAEAVSKAPVRSVLLTRPAAAETTTRPSLPASVLSAELEDPVVEARILAEEMAKSRTEPPPHTKKTREAHEPSDTRQVRAFKRHIDRLSRASAPPATASEEPVAPVSPTTPHRPR